MINNKWLTQNPLFKECIDALGVDLLPSDEVNRISGLFDLLFPITTWGKIDWNKINQKIFIGYDPNNIIQGLNQLLKHSLTKQDKEVYIEWSDGGIPVIRANLDNIIPHFDDVTCVAFEKFIFNPILGYIIEVRSGDEITIGLVKPYTQIVDIVDEDYLQQVKKFLQEIQELSEYDAEKKLPAIEKEINILLNKIKLYDQAYEVQSYFKLLNSFKDVLRNYHYKIGIKLPSSLQEFLKRFSRIDSQELRERIFYELKKS